MKEWEEDRMSQLCKCGCGASLDNLRDKALWASDACRKRAQRAANPDITRTRPGWQVVLDAFRQVPGHRLTNVELGQLFLQGGPQAFRSRISDLRDKGYDITEGRFIRRGVYEYQLLNPNHDPQPRAGRTDPPADSDRPETADEKLFDVAPSKHKPRGYGDPEWEDAAA